MKTVSAGVRVAILFLLLAVGGYLVWKNLGQDPAGSDNYTLFAKFRDASGLPTGSKVVIAGLPKGEVTGLEVDGRYAKVTFKIDDEIKVWSSGVVIKKATSLLGDNYLEIDPDRRSSSCPMAASSRSPSSARSARRMATRIASRPTPAARSPM
ncbi:MAG: MlaD family protein [Kofleriaceae bacterium]